MSLKKSAPYLAARQFTRAGLHAGLYLLTGGPGDGLTMVLMYHSVEAPLPWAVPAEMFRKQMQTLKKYFRVVPFCRIRAECERPSAPGSVVAITFDDGRLDNYVQGLPILEETGLKATFFVTTGAVGGYSGTAAYRSPMMDAKQIREMVSLGHEMGAHTVTHARLPLLPRSEVYAELRDSRRQLEDLVGKEVVSLAYPFGAYNQEVCECAAEAGFTFAGIVKNALVSPKVDWLRIPRISIDHTVGSGLYFRAKASRAVELFERVWGGTSPVQEY